MAYKVPVRRWVMVDRVETLFVRLSGVDVGTLVLLHGTRTIFSFNQAYVDAPAKPTLSLSFLDQFGTLMTRARSTNLKVPQFFSNLLPEGALRPYLAGRAGVKEHRDFLLLRALSADLPGAVEIASDDQDGGAVSTKCALRFSLAGVQMKFSVLKGAGDHGLMAPVGGVGGDWVLKLPSQTYAAMPENEFSMMSLAARLGMDVPEVQLVDLQSVEGLPADVGGLSGQALAVKRFDRGPGGRVHIEDFAQVFGQWPENKYGKATMRNIATVIAAKAPHEADEFIRRLVYNTLIGNGDMHLKNWSLIYRDQINPSLAPAYDFLSTIPYIPNDDSALRYVSTKKMEHVGSAELQVLAEKAGLPVHSTLAVARQTVEQFLDEWPRAKADLPIAQNVAESIDSHLQQLALIRDFVPKVYFVDRQMAGDPILEVAAEDAIQPPVTSNIGGAGA